MQTMSREKQIEEMAKELCQNNFCNTDCHARCRLPANSYCWDVEIIAEKLYNAGYRKQSEWISVDERLPPKNEMVLIFCGGAREMDWICSTGLWYDHDYTLVTHWMPLPEAPKMKGGAE